MKFKNLLLTLLIACVAMPLAAQLESGKIYRFVNKADASISMEASSPTDIYGAKTGDRYSQYWLAEKHPSNNDAWSLRSLGNGLYVKPMGTSTGWTFAVQPSSSTVLYCLSTGSNYYTFNSTNSTSNSNCMHYATSQGGRVVGWNTGADATHWAIEEVSLSEEELQANWDELNAFNNVLTEEFVEQCETALANLFSDKACTELKKSFASVTELEADADYQALPEPLQAMAKKVFTGDWSEANFDSSKKAWDSEHAKRFRIQSVEPYSIAGTITEWLGLNAHINMDNPTGITGNYRQHVYLFVEGEIKSGAELYLGSLVGHGLLSDYQYGTRLKEGLNIIPFHANGNTLYINYVVKTYENGRFTNKLSDYSPIKVHFAGGNVNGFFNGVGDHLWGEPDDDEDWKYYEERTNTESATLLGKRQILHFTMWPTQVTEEDKETGKTTTRTETNCMSEWASKILVPAGTPSNKKVNAMLEAWDRIHLSELATMGLLSKAEMDSLNNLYPRWDATWKNKAEIYNYSDAMYANQNGRDYSEYFNHHGISLGNFSGYMSGGWKNCNYNQNTMGSIIGEIAKEAGPTWGPAHEIGHQHQKIFTVNGLTEVTNNMHSNIAVWYMGFGTSRVNGTEGNLDNVYYNYKNKNHYLFHRHSYGGSSQNLWSQTQMFYKLWLYYHRAGHKTDFFPTLFELHRQDRMSSSNLGWIDGKGHASGTESMLKYYKQACVAAQEDLTEFFRAHGFFVLMNQQERGDYSTSYYTQTQNEVDAAIAWVKAKGYPENLAPLFINDAVSKPTYSHDGKTVRSYWDGETQQGKNAKVGMYTECIDNTVEATGYYYNTTVENNSGKVTYKLNINMKDDAKGAIGFIVYKDGELIAFTNNYVVELPKAVGTSPIEVYAIQANGEKAELLTAAEAGTESEQLTALAASINKAKSILSLKVKDGSETGYYFASDLTQLNELYLNALNAYNKKDQSVNTYGRWSVLLDTEYNKVTAASYMNIKEKAVYRITNGKKNKYALTSKDGLIKATTDDEVAADNDSKLWYLESTGNDGEYYIKSKDGYYITYVEDGMDCKTSKTGTKKVFRVEHKASGLFKFITDGSTAEASIYLDESDLAATGKFSSQITTNDNLAYWRLVVVEGLEESRNYEKDIIKALIARADGILEKAVSNDGETMVVNHDIVAPTDTTMGAAQSLQSFFTAIAEVRNIAEVAIYDETILDYLPYITEVRNVFAETDANYLFRTPTMPETDSETIYYIRSYSTEDGSPLYCGADSEGKVAHRALKGVENNQNYWWTFVSTGDGKYKLKNVGNGNYLYRNSRGIWTNSSTKGDDITLVAADYNAEKAAEYGLKIKSGSYYLITTDNEYVGSKSALKDASYWVIEKLQFNSWTGIEEIEDVEGENNTIEGIFDLTGRKIEQITQPGIYIVNGKKMLVK